MFGCKNIKACIVLVNKIIQYVIDLLTFPGVISHLMAHYWSAKMLKIKVISFKIFDFKFNSRYGYVIDKFSSYSKLLIFIFAPLVINSILSIMAFALSSTIKWHNIEWLFMWLGVSFGVRALPTDADNKVLGYSLKITEPTDPVIVILIANLMHRFFIFMQLFNNVVISSNLLWAGLLYAFARWLVVFL